MGQGVKLLGNTHLKGKNLHLWDEFYRQIFYLKNASYPMRYEKMLLGVKIGKNYFTLKSAIFEPGN